MNTILTKWLSELTNEFELNTSLENQANENLHSFSFAESEKFESEEIAQFIEACSKLVLSKSKNIMFYSWVDEMASQLRFSAINNTNSCLPFECKYQETNIQTIAKETKDMTTPLYSEGYLNVWVSK
jgi:hypothetical protein